MIFASLIIFTLTMLTALHVTLGSSVADPDFYPFRIPDPKTAIKERGEKKLVVKPFFVATNFTKL
jgi:hypothetical protein